MRVARPVRSPVTEWHLAHLASKNCWPAFASPTRMLGGSLPTPGGMPCRPIVAICGADVGGDGLSVGRRHLDGRHVAPAVLNYRNDILAFLVDDGELGAEQIGSAHVAAAQVGAVAGGATDAVDRFSAGDLLGILGFALLAGDEAATAPPPSTAGAARPLARGGALRHHDRAERGRCQYLSNPHDSSSAPRPNLAFYVISCRRRVRAPPCPREGRRPPEAYRYEFAWMNSFLPELADTGRERVCHEEKNFSPDAYRASRPSTTQTAGKGTPRRRRRCPLSTTRSSCSREATASTVGQS